IRINGEGVDAVISLQLSGIDTGVIEANARHEDNHGNRVRLLKELIGDELGIVVEGSVFFEYDFTWRATKRSAELRFANVWETDDATLRPTGDFWQVVVDFPFDRDHHTPVDDLERLATFRKSQGSKGAKSLVWLPL